LEAHSTEVTEGRWTPPGIGSIEDLTRACEEGDLERLSELLDRPIPGVLAYEGRAPGRAEDTGAVVQQVRESRAAVWMRERAVWRRDHQPRKVEWDLNVEARICEKVLAVPKRGWLTRGLLFSIMMG